MSIHYLKIKVTSLAAESALIRKEEQRVKPKPVAPGARKRLQQELEAGNITLAQRIRIERRLAKPTTEQVRTFWGLRSHRVDDLRPESRAALIAYCFLKGTPYHKAERNADTNPNWDRAIQLILKYGKPVAAAPGWQEDLTAQFKAWAAVSAPEQVTAIAA